MVLILSYIFAVIITAIIAIILYPLSALLFLFGKLGHFVGFLSNFIFHSTNRMIKSLWSDIRHTKIIRDDTNEETSGEMLTLSTPEEILTPDNSEIIPSPDANSEENKY